VSKILKYLHRKWEAEYPVNSISVNIKRFGVPGELSIRQKSDSGDFIVIGWIKLGDDTMVVDPDNFYPESFEDDLVLPELSKFVESIRNKFKLFAKLILVIGVEIDKLEISWILESGYTKDNIFLYVASSGIAEKADLIISPSAHIRINRSIDEEGLRLREHLKTFGIDVLFNRLTLEVNYV